MTLGSSKTPERACFTYSIRKTSRHLWPFAVNSSPTIVPPCPPRSAAKTFLQTPVGTTSSTPSSTTSPPPAPSPNCPPLFDTRSERLQLPHTSSFPPARTTDRASCAMRTRPSSSGSAFPPVLLKTVIRFLEISPSLRKTARARREFPRHFWMYPSPSGYRPPATGNCRSCSRKFPPSFGNGLASSGNRRAGSGNQPERPGNRRARSGN